MRGSWGACAWRSRGIAAARPGSPPPVPSCSSRTRRAAGPASAAASWPQPSRLARRHASRREQNNRRCPPSAWSVTTRQFVAAEQPDEARPNRRVACPSVDLAKHDFRRADRVLATRIIVARVRPATWAAAAPQTPASRSSRPSAATPTARQALGDENRRGLRRATDAGPRHPARRSTVAVNGITSTRGRRGSCAPSRAHTRHPAATTQPARRVWHARKERRPSCRDGRPHLGAARQVERQDAGATRPAARRTARHGRCGPTRKCQSGSASRRRRPHRTCRAASPAGSRTAQNTDDWTSTLAVPRRTRVDAFR